MKKLTVSNLTLMLAFLMFGAISFTMSSCSGKEKTEEMEEEATEQTDDETSGAGNAGTAAAAGTAASQLNRHVADDNTVIEYSADRATYQPAAAAAGAAGVAGSDASADVSPFDVAPMFGDKCKTADDPAACTHDELGKYLSRNIQVPEEIEEVEGVHKEIISFVVLPDGSINTGDIRFVPQEDRCPKCAAEALRLVKEMPKWIPATKEGVPVPARVTVPVTFNIQ